MTSDIKRILVPLDFSDSSTRALDFARGLATKLGAAIHLVHVCELPTMMSPSMDAYAIAYTDWTKLLGDEAENELRQAATTLPGLKVTTEVMFGPPAYTIVEAATENKSDLIVMGTHGRGSVMHVLMGNVAERVVRLAPCPVLTIRAPKESINGAGAKAAGVAAAVLALLLMPSASAFAQQPELVQTQSATTGGELFKTYCATCHGTAARGDGPLASSMVRKPSNLTEVAKRNGGVFPSDLVFKMIDGRQAIKGHGGPDMPVWGDAFSKSREAGDAERVKKVIQSLVDYLDSIQLRTTHDQQ